MTFNFKSHPDWICSVLGHKSGLPSHVSLRKFPKRINREDKTPLKHKYHPWMQREAPESQLNIGISAFLLTRLSRRNTQPLPPLLYFRPLSVSPINLLTCKVFLLRYLITAIRKKPQFSFSTSHTLDYLQRKRERPDKFLRCLLEDAWRAYFAWIVPSLGITVTCVVFTFRNPRPTGFDKAQWIWDSVPQGSDLAQTIPWGLFSIDLVVLHS